MFYHQHSPRGGLFRGGELARLGAMVMMLVLLVMMIGRARDPNLWRWLADDRADDPAAQAETTGLDAPSSDAPSSDATTTDATQPPSGPTDLDADEAEAAREEFQALSDATPLGDEEMPAYWRLVKWQSAQTTSSMLKRARRDVRFAQLLDDPARYRGELVRLDLRIRRVVSHDDVNDPAAGDTEIYEAWGTTKDSKAWLYLTVFTDPPEGMPLGLDIGERVSFAGYFLKTTPYQNGLGETIIAPMLIGRLQWHPAPQSVTVTDDEQRWVWILGGSLALVMTLRLALLWRSSMRARRAVPADRAAASDAAHLTEPVEQWLARAEDASANDTSGTNPRKDPGHEEP